MDPIATGEGSRPPVPGARPELVLVPGLLNDADLWRDQIAALSDVARCRVADITRGETMEALVGSVLAAAPPVFALAGFSLGGYVAQEVMRIAPGRVARLALLDTSMRADTPARAAERRALAEAARVPGRFHGFGDRLLATYLHPANLENADIVRRIQEMARRLGPETFLRQNAIERKDGEAVLRSVACPTLVLCGEGDALTPPSEHRAMARLDGLRRLGRRDGRGESVVVRGHVRLDLLSYGRHVSLPRLRVRGCVATPGRRIAARALVLGGRVRTLPYIPRPQMFPAGIGPECDIVGPV